jgi:hypothetical protein
VYYSSPCITPVMQHVGIANAASDTAMVCVQGHPKLRQPEAGGLQDWNYWRRLSPAGAPYPAGSLPGGEFLCLIETPSRPSCLGLGNVPTD